jgi:dienelactone hydrolase
VVFSAIGALLLVFVAVIPALILPQFTLPKPTGKYEIAAATYTYTDESRVETFTNTGEKRKVNIKFWYPKGADGKYPLVVFSHGTGGINISNTSTFMNLASNGYVVCSIDHPYHSQFSIGADGSFVRMDQAYWQEYLDVVNHKITDEGTRLQITLKWLALRTADMNFVLNTILAQAQDNNSAEVYHLIDPTKVGLMGHSIGGAEAAQVARERNDISAVVNLDGDLSGEYLDFVNGAEVLNDKPFPVSILNIFTDDMARLIDKFPNPSEIVAAEHVLLTAPHGYDVRLTGTNHFSVTDLPLVSPFFVSMMRGSVPGVSGAEADPYATIEKMNGIVLQFFNAYLKGEGAFSAAGTY